jgi:hypothetical protein
MPLPSIWPLPYSSCSSSLQAFHLLPLHLVSFYSRHLPSRLFTCLVPLVASLSLGLTARFHSRRRPEIPQAFHEPDEVFWSPQVSLVPECPLRLPGHEPCPDLKFIVPELAALPQVSPCEFSFHSRLSTFHLARFHRVLKCFVPLVPFHSTFLIFISLFHLSTFSRSLSST